MEQGNYGARHEQHNQQLLLYFTITILLLALNQSEYNLGFLLQM